VAIEDIGPIKSIGPIGFLSLREEHGHAEFLLEFGISAWSGTWFCPLHLLLLPVLYYLLIYLLY
jgi:hypothetical protein